MPSEEICSWQMEGRKFEEKSGVGALHWQKMAKWTRLNSGGIPFGES